jgi:hypothetical protein
MRAMTDRPGAHQSTLRRPVAGRMHRLARRERYGRGGEGLARLPGDSLASLVPHAATLDPLRALARDATTITVVRRWHTREDR